MHKYTYILLIILISSTIAHATPELKGSPTELSSYLSNLPKVVALTGEAKIVLQAESGVVTIGIRSENPQLQKALQNSQKLRKQISGQLVKSGFAQKSIKGTKFSSTPEYGLFGKKPNNYIVDNLFKITVENESQLQEVASIVDDYKEAYYQGLELKEQKKEEIRRQLLDFALANANDRKEVYETKLELTLKPISFEENISVEQPEVKLRHNTSKRAYSSIDGGSSYGENLSLGEHVYYGKVHIKYQISDKAK